MAETLKYGFLGHREKIKFNGRSLRMKVYRLGGFAPIKKKIKIKTDNISRLVWAESDKLQAKVLQAIKGENVCYCLYVVASRGPSGKSKTFRFEVVRKGLLMKREDKKSIEEALEFARKVAKGVGLYETKGDDDSFIWSRERSTVVNSNVIKSLDAESDDESGDDLFEDDEPDDD
jgi:hypothetical protein